MKVVIVRLDLDRYDALTLSKLVKEGVITTGDACEARAVRSMSALHRLMWVRQVQELGT